MKSWTLVIAALCASAAFADNQVSITLSGDQRCVTSNATPTHSIGRFPNSGNRNRFRAQDQTVCFDATPEQTGTVTGKTHSSGVSLTGILFRPGTADFYDPTSPRGFSRDPSSGWRLEGMGAADQLGMDQNHAHVDHRGLYHYHAVPDTLTDALDGTMIGYAADGFPIHYAGTQAVSSWQLKPGQRSSAPHGNHDGTFVEDWQHVPGSGNLDNCNGAMIDGQYVYFATDSYPFFPRCFKGTVSRDFLGRP